MQDLPQWDGDPLADRLRRMYGDVGLSRIRAAFPDGGLDSGRRPTRRAPETAVIVSCYPDHLGDGAAGATAAETLRQVGQLLSPVRRDVVVHLLPPYLADDGDRFSLIDDSVVDPALGDWADLGAARPWLALDLIVNQLSVNSPWFREFTEGRGPDLFFTPEESFDFRRVASSRGRGLIRHATRAGRRVRVWSSHGGQQVDVDYRSSEVLLWAFERLSRLSRGARHLRLDGIAFGWKESGTSCVNLPQARTLSDVLSAWWRVLCPDGYVVAEVDAFEGDLAYVRSDSGDGPDLVYDYELPRCVAVALVLADVHPLAAEVERMAARTPVHWCNIVVTHDGLSLRPWVPTSHRHSLERLVSELERSGLPVQRAIVGGSELPYEVDVLPADLDPPARGALGVPDPRCADLATSLLMTLPGVPMVYLPALLGLRSTPVPEGADPRGRVRARIPLDALAGPELPLRMLSLRSTVPALRASSPARVLTADGGLLVFSRGHEVEVVVVHNFSAHWRTVHLERPGHDLLGGVPVEAGPLEVAPRTALWVSLEPGGSAQG
ncbi:hypothetical protein AB0425_26290 [Actinosynnema sp. NPDC051121]